MSLDFVESRRVAASQSVDRERRSALGQFFTPSPVAQFMASLMTFEGKDQRLLDPGAGIGSLTAAAIERAGNSELSVVCYEMEPKFLGGLRETLGHYPHVASQIEVHDFIEKAVLKAVTGKSPGYTHVILNPPYKKIPTDSAHRTLVRKLGLETSNLYTCFLGCSVALCKPGAQVVAIIPRSFMNGLYFKPFRYWLLDRVALTHIHVFDSRDRTFKDDEVLQENIIVRMVVGATQSSVEVSVCNDQAFSDLRHRTAAFAEVVTPGDEEQFIHIPAVGAPDTNGLPGQSLRDLGLDVCTGPVVDFRMRGHLRITPEPDTVPLLYATHFLSGRLTWPVQSRKPNAIVRNKETERWLMPNTGSYVVTRRFSSKEEQRRVMAFVVDTTELPAEVVGFENHLNVFHQGRRGMPPDVARGLAAYLNSEIVDDYFRTFSGHTQVNATDLRRLRYPSIEELRGIAMSKTTEALAMLVAVGMPRAQQNERSALCLLALTNVTGGKSWRDADAPLVGITPIMDFAREHFDKDYAPNTRETVRRQTMHQFCDAGIAIYNPDDPGRPVNSPKAVYQISPEALALIRTYGTDKWDKQLKLFLKQRETLADRYAKVREMRQVPLEVAPGKTIKLSPGEHSVLIRQIAEVFGPHYAPGGKLIYAGDTGDKWGYFDKDALEALGVTVESHGKMPDVVIHYIERNWLLLIEAVTSHGPVDGKRHDELRALFARSKAGLVYVTAFPSRAVMSKYLASIAWETEVWCSEAPTHLIHFNGERFLGPY